MSVIYLDNNATTPLAPGVLDAMLPYLTELYGNPSSLHTLGQQSRYAVENARDSVASLLEVKPNQLLFTSCGTESINTLIRSALASSKTPRIITSTVEHSATLSLCKYLEKQNVQVDYIPVDSSGVLDLDRLKQALVQPAALATFLSANNETGILFDAPAIVSLCHAHNTPIHLDATQSVGKVPMSAMNLDVDALSCSAHKFHGPKGVGILYLRKKSPFLPLTPLLQGGPQEINRRAGTENVAGIVGTGHAALLAKKSLPLDAVARLRDHFEENILKSIPQTAVVGAQSPRLPNTSLITFKSLQSQAILMALSEQNLCASAGSACASGSLAASHVLKAMKIDEKQAFGAVRFSLSRFTTWEEIQQGLEILPAIIAKLRKTLPAEE